MRNKLWNDSLRIYKSHPLTSWILSLMFGVFMSLILLICFWGMGLSLLLIPLIVLPSLFATMVAHYLLKENQTITFGAYFTYFINYFRTKFRSSFRFFSSLFWALLFGLIVSIACSFIAYFSAIAIDETGFLDAQQRLTDLLYNPTEIVNFSSLEQILGDNYYVFSIYLIISYVPMVFVMWFVFFYHISRNSITIYLRLASKNIFGNDANIMYRFTYQKHKREFNKDYWMLNFPLYILMVVGFLLCGSLCMLKTFDLGYVCVASLLGASILPIFFYPFYFANMEALYNKYSPRFKNSLNELAKMQLESIAKSIYLNEQLQNELKQKLNEQQNNEKENDDVIDNDEQS